MRVRLEIRDVQSEDFSVPLGARMKNLERSGWPDIGHDLAVILQLSFPASRTLGAGVQVGSVELVGVGNVDRRGKHNRDIPSVHRVLLVGWLMVICRYWLDT